MDGQWEGLLDLTDPAPAGNDSSMNLCGTGLPSPAHHCYITAVHAVHLYTGELLLYHGDQDERVLDLHRPVTEPYAVRWTPPANRIGDPLSPSSQKWPDLFCSGHAQLADGSILVAGGNVTSRPVGGGLDDLYRFDPGALRPTATGYECPGGWQLEPSGNTWVNPLPQMDTDRWYPTLTTLGDGKVLITGGTSRADIDPMDPPWPVSDAVNSRKVELFDPTANPPTIERLPDFPANIEEVPIYPFIFALPNGDVLYAGGESTSDPAVTQGRVLVSPANTGTDWEWSPHAISSEITGASAVMYAPGKILKSGGRAIAPQDEHGASPSDPNPDGETDFNTLRTHRAERIDLSNVPGGLGSYAGLAFEPAASMQQARHFHNLVLLPNGTVLAVGGNSAGNVAGGDHYQNPCEIGGAPVMDASCSQGCPSVCVAYETLANQHLQCDDSMITVPTDERCAFVDFIDCCAGRTQPECTVPGCTWDSMVGICTETGGAPDRCGEALTDAYCSGGQCRKDCTTPGASCGTIQPVNGQCLLPAQEEYPGQCPVRNNECFATKTAEIWDPTCDTWEELGEQQYPRMYHSTALLLPDTTVLSMGNGHTGQGFGDVTDYPVSELLEPQYAPGGDTDPPVITVLSEGGGPADLDYLPYYDAQEPWGRGSVAVQATGDVAEFNLIRLGSTTHGFDQDQRIVPVIGIPSPQSGSEGNWVVFAPPDDDLWTARNIAPPGYYMLFAVSPEGTPSFGPYLRLGQDPATLHLCEADPLVLAATKTRCAGEPVGGSCAPADEVVVAAALPLAADGSGGTVEGWRVVMRPGVASSAKGAEETLAACEATCAAFFSADESLSASCDAPGAITASQIGQDVRGALDLILPGHVSGGHGIGTVGCDLSRDCFAAFDEDLVLTAAERLTPAADPLHQGEEFRVALGGSEASVSCGTQDPLTIALAGEAGFSYCAQMGTPCPFYLGSMALSSAPNAALEIACDDGSTESATLESVTIRLGQPAFGVEDAGAVQLAPGALVLETELVVDGTTYGVRRPNGVALTMQGTGSAIDPDPFMVAFEVPCNTGAGQLRFGVDVDSSGVLARPPTASLSLPSSVSCGASVSLTGTFADPDGDLDEVRWFVDDVELDPGVTSLAINAAHEVRAVALDSRGAATTATAQITCP